MRNGVRILVVGTTTDYVDWIRKTAPGRAVFLTDSCVRENARESIPSAAEEVLCDLANYDEARHVLREHLESQRIVLEGLVCFDCESMELSAILAEEYDLPYPLVETIKICRDKYLQKQVWVDNGVPCPRSRLISTPDDAANFWRDIGRACVLKPLTGSGSELVYLCKNETECRKAFTRIIDGLEERKDNRLYQLSPMDAPLVIAEVFVSGTEHSCDFAVENKNVEIIRVARKILAPNSPFGTIQAYDLSPGAIDPIIRQPDFPKLLYRAASALDITEAICMVDFLVQDNQIIFLELTPRPGGDCLPAVLRESAEIDILTTALDFSVGNPIAYKNLADFEPCIGVRIHADREGTFLRLKADELQDDIRIRKILVSQPYGHVVQMPPKDYDSWLLGYIIFQPDLTTSSEEQCKEILGKVKVLIV